MTITTTATTTPRPTTESAHPMVDEPVARRAPRRPNARTFVHWLAVVVGVAALAIGVLFVRGWRPWSSSTDSTVMPVSPQIEQAYGVRFTAVGVTAGGGMIMIRYQVLDSDKTAVIHNQDSAPFVVDEHGVAYKDPGLVGHSHIGPAKAAGTTDFVLLANARGGVQAGHHVTIHIGKFTLAGVPVV